MKKVFFTITGTKYRFGHDFLEPGMKVTLEKEPDNATYLDTYGWILHLQGLDQKAKPYFKHAMLYGGRDSAVILSHYAEVLDALGEHDLAKSFRMLAEKKPKEE